MMENYSFVQLPRSKISCSFFSRFVHNEAGILAPSSSYWEDPAMNHLQCSYWKEVVAQNLVMHGPIHPHLVLCSGRCTLCRNAPPKDVVSTPMLQSGPCAWVCTHPFLPKSSIFNSSGHMPPLHHPDGPRTCVVLSRELGARCRILNHEGVLCFSRLAFDQVLPGSSRLCPHLSHDHWFFMRRELARSPSDGAWQSFWVSSIFNYCLLTKLLAYCPVPPTGLLWL